MIEPTTFFGLFLGLCGAGAVISLFLPERRQPAGLAWIGSLAALVLVAASGGALLWGRPLTFSLWPLFSLGTLTITIDRLAALFVLVLGLVFLPVSVFSGRYLAKYVGEYRLGYFSRLYYGFFASLVLVFIAGDALSFLWSWEIASVLGYLLVNYLHKDEESAGAGLMMIAMSEAGAIAVVVGFAILVGSAGGIDFESIRAAAPGLSEPVGFAVFVLFFFGFGVKAGLIPFNSWLPRAHPVAPTNVSALLSGVMVNLGIYGILRGNIDLLPVAFAGRGLLVLVIGSATALIGILYATIATDLKRLLAHSTIENMGLVVASLGAALVFKSAGLTEIAGIAVIAALYHTVNHSFYKTLLFIGTGAVEQATGSRDLDRLGGLMRVMPWTAAFFLIGAWSISALPPLNGFVSEWLTLQTVLRSAELASSAGKIIFALSGAALALTAGLAVTCFVKAFAMGFLGVARSSAARGAREAPLGTRGPMAFLAACCILLGVLPTYAIPAFDRTAAPLVGGSATDALVPPFFVPDETAGAALPAAFRAEFHDLGAEVGKDLLPGRGLVVLHRGRERNPVVFAMSTSYMTAALAVLMLVVYVVFRTFTRRRSVAHQAAWDGGLRRLRPEYTYTATGFSNPVRVVFHALLRPQTVEDSTEAVAGHFRTAIRRKAINVHIVDRFVVHPTTVAMQRMAGALRRMHSGHVNAYAMYVLVAVILALVLGRGREILSLLTRAMGIDPQ